MLNGKISDNGKRIITWCIAIGIVFLGTTICVHACKRNVECHFDASRSRVTIQYLDPDSHSSNVMKNGKKNR